MISTSASRKTLSSGSPICPFFAGYPRCTGANLRKVLSDCKAVLVAGVGEKPSTILQSNGVRVIQMSGLIDSGLDAVYLNTPLKTLCKTDFAKCGDSCRGNSMGCG